MTEPIVASANGNGDAPITSAPAPGSTPIAASDSTWYAGFDQETVGWMENRGLTKLDMKDALANSINGFRNAEKYIGVPSDKLLRLPDWDKADKVELDQFYNKLGRPTDPKGYKVDVPEGMPTDLADWSRTTFHELGLSEKQGNALAEKWNTLQESQRQQMTEGFKQKFQAEEVALKREWGAAFDQEVGLAKNAAKKLGLDDQMIQSMEQQLGFGGLMKRMNEIGRKLGEDGYVSGNSNNGVMTPAQARSKIAQLQGDKDFVQKYLAGNVQAREEMNRLHEFMSV